MDILIAVGILGGLALISAGLMALAFMGFSGLKIF